MKWRQVEPEEEDGVTTIPDQTFQSGVESVAARTGPRSRPTGSQTGGTG